MKRILLIAMALVTFALTIQAQTETDTRSLNDIRFENFSDDDWLDNDYIHALRDYINDVNQGVIKDENLDPYRNVITGKFVVFSIEPFIAGGVELQVVFVDNPENIFTAWVYSDVDPEGTPAVSGYRVNSVQLDEMKCEFSTEEIMEIVGQDEKMKLF